MNRSNFLKLLGIGALIPFVPKWLLPKPTAPYVVIKQDNRVTFGLGEQYQDEVPIQYVDEDGFISVCKNGVTLDPSEYKIEEMVVTIL